MRPSSASSNPPSTVVTVDPLDRPAPAPWFPELILLLAWFRTNGWIERIDTALRTPGGRAGTVAARDVFLVLLAYAVSGEPNIKAFYAGLRGHTSALAGLLDRHAVPSRSALSRALARWTSQEVEAFRALFQASFAKSLLPSPLTGLLRDRAGQTYLVFDADGTRATGRVRAVVGGDDHPAVRRRLRGVAPGYTGRKRGEVVRTRTALQQAHSREWLGTWGAPGNGEAASDRVRACQTVTAYMGERDRAPQQAIVRLDGLYGYLPLFATVRAAGLHGVARCGHYALLDDPRVVAVLAGAPAGVFEQPDTGTRREMFEVLSLPWTVKGHPAQIVRLVITRRQLRPGQPRRVGRQRHGWVYELFVTSLPPEGFRAVDVVELYFARGGAEASLADEDREMATDRWCSHHPEAQDIWQILEQWIWNLRILLGRPSDAQVRLCQWAPALPAPVSAAPLPPAVLPDDPPPPPPPPPPRPSEPEAPLPEPTRRPPGPPGRVAEASGRGAGRFGGTDFTWKDGQLICPAGAVLRRNARRVQARGVRLTYEAPARACAGCRLSERCRGVGGTPSRGRQVSVEEVPNESHVDPPRTDVPAPADTRPAVIPTPPPPDPVWGLLPMYWEDVPAGLWRRAFHDGLRRQVIEVTRVDAVPSRPYDRACRAHRRLSWSERDRRNASRGGETWHIRLAGVPEHLAAALLLREAAGP